MLATVIAVSTHANLSGYPNWRERLTAPMGLAWHAAIPLLCVHKLEAFLGVRCTPKKASSLCRNLRLALVYLP